MYDVQIELCGTWIAVGHGMQHEQAALFARVFAEAGAVVSLWGPTAAGFGRITASAS